MAWQVVIYILETPLPPTSELQYCEQLISPLGLSLLFQQSLPLPRPPDFAVSTRSEAFAGLHAATCQA